MDGLERRHSPAIASSQVVRAEPAGPSESKASRARGVMIFEQGRREKKHLKKNVRRAKAKKEQKIDADAANAIARDEQAKRSIVLIYF